MAYKSSLDVSLSFKTLKIFFFFFLLKLFLNKTDVNWQEERQRPMLLPGSACVMELRI